MPRRNPEYQLQRDVLTHVRARGVKGLMCWHTPNGGSRNVKEAANLKRIGTLAGVSDLLLLRPPGVFCALELKAGKTPLTEAQMEFLAGVADAGSYSFCARSLDEALNALRLWGCIR